MGFKDLFIVNEETSNDKPKTDTAKPSGSNIKFPTAETKKVEESPSILTSLFGQTNSVQAPPTFSTPTTVSDEYLEKALVLYQNGFDSLNQPGFDFYEFYQSVANAGISNPQIYTMAFSLASSMDKTVTKDKLVQQAEYYISEIGKVYTDFVSKGNAKKIEVESQKTQENQSLINELNVMNQQLEALKIQIEDRNKKLSAIGTKYDPQLIEIGNKLNANTMAKDKIIQSIEQVKNGIITNIK